jgi:hypothetical protein
MKTSIRKHMFRKRAHQKTTQNSKINILKKLALRKAYAEALWRNFHGKIK